MQVVALSVVVVVVAAAGVAASTAVAPTCFVNL
jgi:hypothetical protein